MEGGDAILISQKTEKSLGKTRIYGSRKKDDFHVSCFLILEYTNSWLKIEGNSFLRSIEKKKNIVKLRKLKINLINLSNLFPLINYNKQRSIL